MVYKSCIVPQCSSTSIKTPDKSFVSVPTHPKKRKMWLKLARRDPQSILTHTNVFMCEDHFDMEKDTINYMKYKMGYSQKILLADKALPSKFNCQEDRRRRLPDPGFSRPAFLKRQRADLITECLQSQSATVIHAESLQKDDNMIQTIVEPEDPEPNDDRNTSTSSTRDNQTTPQATAVKCCRFCRRVQDVSHITDKPYVTLNKTRLTINDLRIEVDFNEDTKKTVCANCDSKLIEIFEFIKVAKEVQDRRTNTEVHDLSNLNTQNEEYGMTTGSDFGNYNYNKTNDQRGVEWLYESDSESVTQTVVAHKRKGDLKNHDGKKKRRDHVLDPLSLNNDIFDDNDTNEMLKCKDEIDDKEYVKEVITVNGSEYDETTEIKEIIETMNDEEQQIQPKHQGIEIAVSKAPQAYATNKNIIEETEIKEEIIEITLEMKPTEG